MAMGNPSKPNARFQDITGQRFGRLVAVRFVGYGPHSKQLWEFRCDCGRQVVKRSNSVTADAKRGLAPGCGCRQSAGNRRTHGKHGTPEYVAWKAMRQRCNAPNSIGYANYGGRGIKVCERWSDFANFLADMGPKPSPDHTPERVDNDGDYEPGNVRWATRAEQSRNTRQNHLVTYQGRTMCVVDWAKELGLKPDTLFVRLRRGASPEEALRPSVQRQEPRPITFNGETLTAKEWARRTGIPYPTVLYRLRRGWPAEKILAR